MKLNEIFNNYPNVYFNVLPPDHSSKPSGNMIAAIMRAHADEQGTMDTEYEHEAEADELWPDGEDSYGDDEYYEEPDDSEDEDWEEEVIQRAKDSLEQDSETEKVQKRNRKMTDVSDDVIYR